MSSTGSTYQTPLPSKCIESEVTGRQERHERLRHDGLRIRAVRMVKQPRSSKRQIEANRRDKAERKRLRKIERVNDSGVAEGDGTSDAPMDHDAVIAALAQLHQAYADGDVSLEDLEAGRLELTSRLHVD